VTPSFFLGVDIGQAQDPTAIALLELVRTMVRTGPIVVEDIRFRLRNLERLELGTPYPDVTAKVQRTLAMPWAVKGGCELIVDATGVGRAPVDYMKKANLRPIAVTITGGDIESHVDWRWNVPKRNLVHATNLLIQTGRLEIAAGIKDIENFKTELKNFKVKVSAGGHDSYEAEKSGDHDDEVLAVAMSGWRGLKYAPLLYRVPKPLPTPKEWGTLRAEELAKKLQVRRSHASH
jgi:hypothetical protein